MTTLTQSDLDDLRRETEAFGYETTMSDEIALALLDHIAQLTAELDEATKYGALSFEITKRDARIAELEAQPSAQFVAGMRETLRKLSNEVLGCASAFEPELRQYLSHTNFNILVQRAEEARAILAEASALEAPQKIESPKEGEILEPRYSDRCWREVPPIDRDAPDSAEAALKGEGE